MKKGKTIKLATKLFSNQKNSSEKEMALINAVDENLCIQSMPGNVKLSAPGLSKVAAKTKKNRR